MSSIRRAVPVLHTPTCLNREPVRYLAASALALAVDLGSFSLALRGLHLGWPSATTLGFVAGAITAYMLSIHWVFEVRSQRARPLRELTTFVMIGVLGLIVTQLTLWTGIEMLHGQPELVRLSAAGLTFAFNYLLRTTVLFRKRSFIPGMS